MGLNESITTSCSTLKPMWKKFDSVKAVGGEGEQDLK